MHLNNEKCRTLQTVNFLKTFLEFSFILSIFFLSFDHSPRKSVKKQFNINWKKPFKRCIWSIFTSCAECRFKESSAVYFYFKFLKVVLPLALDSAFATFFFNSKDSRTFLYIVPFSTYVFDMDQDFLVSVLDVHKDNLQFIWPSLVCSIQNSSFISLDCVNE